MATTSLHRSNLHLIESKAKDPNMPLLEQNVAEPGARRVDHHHEPPTKQVSSISLLPTIPQASSTVLPESSSRPSNSNILLDENNNENSNHHQHEQQQQLAVDIDMNQFMEDQNLDDLLDELLSDDVDCSPKSELDLDLVPSPTFQKFWDSADDDDVEDTEQVADDDDNNYCSEIDLDHLSKLIDEIDIEASASRDSASRRGQEEFYQQQPPSTRTNNDGNTTNDTDVLEYVAGHSTTSSYVNNIRPNNTATVSDDEVEHADKDNLSSKAPTLDIDCGRPRRMSTGCIPDSTRNASLTLALNEEEDHGDEHLGIKMTKTESPVGELDLFAEDEEDDHDIKPSASTPIEDCQPIVIQQSKIKHEADLDVKLSGSNDSDISEPIAIEDVEIKAAVLITSSTSTDTNSDDSTVDSCTSPISDTGDKPEEDPYEWAYNVWRRKGLMAGSPTSRQRPASASASNPPTPAQEIVTAESADSVQTNKPNANRELARLRGPRDRLSLPAMKSPFQQFPNAKPKAKTARNGAGFSILLSKWKDKSDGNPNAHFLSPTRALSPVRPTQPLTSPYKNNNNFFQGNVSNTKTKESATEQVTQEVTKPVAATIDTSPVLSPSRRRKSLDHKMLRDFPSHAISSDTNKAEIPSKQDQNACPMPSINENALEHQMLRDFPSNDSDTNNAEKTPKQDQNAWPTPFKNKNALARFLQRTKPTPTEPKTFGEMCKESRSHQFITEAVEETIEPLGVNRNYPPLDDTTALSTRSRCDDRSNFRMSISPTSTTMPFFSPAGDTLLEPRDVMRHRRQASDRSTCSKTTARSARSAVAKMSAPCQEIFVIKDDQNENGSIYTGLYSDDLKSMATESECHQSVDFSTAQKMHFTNLHDILETKVDSMSFDSKSEVTHITFRTETIRNLDTKVNAIKTTNAPRIEKAGNAYKTNLDMTFEETDENAEPPNRETMVAEMCEMTGATPNYSERPWRKDLLVRNVTTAMDKASGSKFECDCEYSLAMFSAQDEMVDFFLPLMTVSCSCRKSKKLVDSEDPYSLENILRPWQISFLKAFGILKGDQLVKAHHRSAKSLAKSLYDWRQKNNMTTFRMGSCGMALQIWSNTCKAYVRSMRKQISDGVDPIERPNTLSVLSTFLEKMPTQMHRNLPQPPNARPTRTGGSQEPSEDSLEEI